MIELPSTRNTIRARKAKSCIAPSNSAGQQHLFFFPSSSPAENAPWRVWFAGFAAQLQGKSNAHHSRPGPCLFFLFPVFFLSLNYLGSIGYHPSAVQQQNEKQNLLSLAARLLHPRFSLSLFLSSQLIFCIFPLPGRLTAYQPVSSNDGHKAGGGSGFPVELPASKEKLQGA